MTEEYKSCDNCNHWKDSIYCRKDQKECGDYRLWEPIDEEEAARDEYRKLHSRHMVVSPKIEEPTSDKINRTIIERLENEINNNHKIIKLLKEISKTKTEAFNDLLYSSNLKNEVINELKTEIKRLNKMRMRNVRRKNTRNN